MSLGFQPQTDGQTERANRSIEEMLRVYVGKWQYDWDEQLGMVEFIKIQYIVLLASRHFICVMGDILLALSIY